MLAGQPASVIFCQQHASCPAASQLPPCPSLQIPNRNVFIANNLVFNDIMQSGVGACGQPIVVKRAVCLRVQSDVCISAAPRVARWASAGAAACCCGAQQLLLRAMVDTALCAAGFGCKSWHSMGHAVCRYFAPQSQHLTVDTPLPSLNAPRLPAMVHSDTNLVIK